MVVIANSRACWAVERLLLLERSRKVALCWEHGFTTIQFASASWSAVRLEPVFAPSALTSLNSFAYCLLVSFGGASVLNWFVRSSENGRTSPIHAKTLLAVGGTGRHSPGSVPTGQVLLVA